MPNRSTGEFGNKVARLSVIILPLFLAAGCHRDEVKVYHVADNQNQMSAQAAPAMPTDSPAPMLPPGHPNISSLPANSMPAAPAAADAGSPQLSWTTPPGWTEAPPGTMRVASFKVTGANGKAADVSVIPLSGMAGGDSANVNRWRGQVGLPSQTDAELQMAGQSIVAGDQPAQLYDIAGKNPADGTASRILGVIQHRGDTAWFYKMTGDADLVEQQKSAFVDFLKSLNFSAAAAASAPAGEMPATLPPGHPAIGNENPPAGFPGVSMTPAPTTGPISHEGQPAWQVPAGWTEVPAGQFLVAKFTITGDGGPASAGAAVNVSSSSNDGGGLAANVNRWRGQLGLPPISEILTTPLDVAGGKAQMVDITGTNAQNGQPAELIGVIVSQTGQTWFYKLMGDPNVVAAQKAAFTQFVQSAK